MLVREGFFSSLTLKSPRRGRGFTLIEIIIGIVVLAISLSMITSLILPLSKQSADQVQQIKAAELGQSLMNEILGKAFDEHSDKAGGILRCNETGMLACSSTLGAEEANREDYDDVDDYLALTDVAGADLLNAKGQTLGDAYYGFNVNVDVFYDGDFDGIADGNQLAKLVTITVTTPTGDDIVFASYKVNF